MDWPKTLLTQNSEMRKEGIWNWTLPAWWVEIPDDAYPDGTRMFNCCPMAGECAKVCYARNGTYLFPNVIGRHTKNLLYVLKNLFGWRAQMAAELGLPRFAEGGKVRIHDAGDFFSDEYLQAWLSLAREFPHILFYCYTKEVSRFRRLVEGKAPPNFKWVYSLGGREDHLLNKETERHADVFPDEATIAAAGYSSQSASDLLAVLGPPKVGIPANNIPHFKRRQGDRTFGRMQSDRDAGRAPRAD